MNTLSINVSHQGKNGECDRDLWQDNEAQPHIFPKIEKVINKIKPSYKIHF